MGETRGRGRRRRSATSPAVGVEHRDPRPVPAPVDGAPAGRPLVGARRVRAPARRRAGHGHRPRRGVAAHPLELPRPARLPSRTPARSGTSPPCGGLGLSPGPGPLRAARPRAPDPATARLVRAERVRATMSAQGVDALLLSLGADLPWLTGYEAMPLERLTMLVLPVDDAGDPRRPRARGATRGRTTRGCSRCALGQSTSKPPSSWRASSAAGARLAVSDRCWASHLLELERAMPRRSGAGRSEVVGAASGGEGRVRDRGAAWPPERPPTGSPTALLAGRDRPHREDRGRGLGRDLGAGCAPRATTRSTSPSSEAARTRPARTTSRARAASAGARSSCATSAARSASATASGTARTSPAPS